MPQKRSTMINCFYFCLELLIIDLKVDLSTKKIFKYSININSNEITIEYLEQFDK